MEAGSSHIDRYLFERHLHAFTDFVERQSGVPFESFASNPYTEHEEGYKRDVYRQARKLLRYSTWSDSEIGSGAILDFVIQAIELPTNNLVQWQARYGDDARPHQPLYRAMDDHRQLRALEMCFFNLYRGRQPQQCFEEVIEVIGRTYPLVAYLFFLKDCSKYLPIAPTTFERSFAYLGVNFKARQQCSWQNYQAFIDVLGEIRLLLSGALATDVSLLDAHSFAWILARQMEKDSALPDTRDYRELSDTQRQAIVSARIGQGRFRQELLDFWKGCAVTNVREPALLRASHIIPWSEAVLEDRISPFNGLLLAPHLDAAFDGGYVTFSDDGMILLSSELKAADAERLGIHASMHLRMVAPEHKRHLAYHRERVFKQRAASET